MKTITTKSQLRKLHKAKNKNNNHTAIIADSKHKVLMNCFQYKIKEEEAAATKTQ